MYGVVYHDQNHVPQLLVVADDQITVGAISDDDRLYDGLPPDMGEIVEVEQNEAARIVGLKSICCLSLHEKETRFNRFYQGVDKILEDEPTSLADIIMSGIEANLAKKEALQSEGAEVVLWPDGTCVLAEDYRPAQWTHMSDDFARRWCGPNELRGLGLL